MKVRAGIFTTVTLLVGALMLGGCGGAGNESDTSGGAAPAEREEAGGGTGADTGGKRRDPKAGEPPRVVIHSGSLHLEVSDVGKAADEAADLALDADGAIGRDVRTSTDRYDEAKLTLRIPATQFAATLKELSALGKELERDISAEDVSEAMLDLDSRIASKRASVKRVRALLAQAQSLDEISRVEQELTSRESDLANLEAQKRELGNKVDYSTVTIKFTSKERPAPPPAAGEEVGFASGLQSGWHAFKISLQVILTVVGALLPFAIAIGVPLLGVWWWLRRRKRPAVVQPTGAPAGPTAP